MDAMTGLTHKLVVDGYTWDFYRIELVKNSKDYVNLIDYLKTNKFAYEEDVAFGSSIVIFGVLRSDECIHREQIFAMFGGCPYFAMEGNVTLIESALYRCYRQIQERKREV